MTDDKIETVLRTLSPTMKRELSLALSDGGRGWRIDDKTGPALWRRGLVDRLDITVNPPLGDRWFSKPWTYHRYDLTDLGRDVAQILAAGGEIRV